MYKLRMFNMKWQLLNYFLISSLLTVSSIYIVLEYYKDELVSWQFRMWFLIAILLVCLTVGYVATKRWQRKVDELHVAMLELSKGNFSSRIEMEPVEPFLYLYDAFNNMASAVEERIQLLQKLGEAEAIRDQELTENAVLEERRRLARDLHDTVSQELFAIHMSASSLPKILERNPDAAPGVMNQLIQMSHHAQKQMRGLISQLRPIELGDMSLQEALEKWFPEYCRNHELQGKLDVSLHESISEAIEHQFFLIIQEGLANVVKHASAKQVRLAIYEREHQYVLQLQDDGQGFERRDIPSASHGLSTMRERAQKLGGEVEIDSKLGSGTRVRVRIPRFTGQSSLLMKEREGETNEQ
ncbi:sensor histidine kinase [Paenibacillus alginolyticus]|uniref:HAMP domain-containing sensor histidine kinase n=1 Tax=Paenibacillus alginolyticus TaxID=59839 RepID=UPI0003FC620E|nr:MULTISPECIES: sensor histidine kinase [Paenibacillus]MCY9666126.1 sensor histidine kinase [Paenibacillus alginolyticus]NRF93250.1 sensor histidine kinase [Paenibacillus frigoriresistens]